MPADRPPSLWSQRVGGRTEKSHFQADFAAARKMSQAFNVPGLRLAFLTLLLALNRRVTSANDT